LYAFERALSLGVDILDTDVRITKDGALVLIHDRTVDRTTNGSGSVKDFTLSQLKALDAGYGWTADNGVTFPLRGKGIRIPALEEVFVAFPDARVTMEIKASDPALVQSLCRLIQEYKKTEQVLVVSARAETIEAFRQACPEVATSASSREGITFYALNRFRLGFIYSTDAHAFQGPRHMVTPHLVDAAHRLNSRVYVWTVNETGDMQRFLDMGVDGINTDYPDSLLILLGR
jgi:glycerophosphoryl diester phosphodiesterase